MSNLQDEQTYENLEQSIEFILEQYTKVLNTNIPGIIDSYNPTTRRCKVYPAIKRLFTDNSSESMPIIIDVPVVFSSGGGYSVLTNLKKGDAVLICFSQRGISDFKNQFKESIPTNSLLSYHDAIVVPGFGDLEIIPATTTGIALQDKDNNNSIIIEDNKIEIKKNSTMLTLTDNSLVSTVPIHAPDFIVGGNSYISHFHGDVQPGAGNTSTPQN